jgi:VWFA-related protein
MGSMRRWVPALGFLVLAPLVVRAQDAGGSEPTATISVKSSLVVVPALVRTKAGALVFTLKADDFKLTDDGVAQKLRLEEDTGGEPLALVILVETGSDGARRLDQYTQLGAMLDAVVGAVPHKVAVVSFDSAPTLEQPFTAKLDVANQALGELEAGDKDDAIFDGITFAVDLLRKQPVTYRRAILMFSETIDHGSHVKLVDALRAIGDTNTAIYSVAFSSSRMENSREAAKISSEEPGPDHGCFSRDKNADPRTEPSRASQDYDCAAQLLPPLILAKIAATAIVNSFKRNAPETVARLTGGEYFHFKDEKTLDGDLLTISNHLPNRYVLSFQPQNPTPGFHTIELSLPDHTDLKVDARNGYWVEGDRTPEGPEAAPAAVPAH